MKLLSTIGAAALVAILAACSGSSSNDSGPKPSGLTQPAGTVAVNFVVDDTLNKVWKDGELEWKGQVDLLDENTRVAQFNTEWLNHPWAKLYDDGPWDQMAANGKPGHEPLGSVAGDHKLGVTVFIAPPATGSQAFGYGLRDATNPDPAGGGWVWIGPNGEFTIAAGATASINAPGMTFPAHGTTDLMLVLDKNAIDPSFTISSTTPVTVKGSAWAWKEVTLTDDGTGKYTLVLSNVVKPGGILDTTLPPYPGLLKTGDKPEFVFMINGVEYKNGSDCFTAGVTAEAKPSGGSWSAPLTLGITTAPPGQLGGGNTYVTIP